MDRELLVYIDADDEPIRAGRLWARARGAKESASFEYAKDTAMAFFEKRFGKGRLAAQARVNGTS